MPRSRLDSSMSFSGIGLVDLEFVRDHTIGFEELEASIAACSPSWTEEKTGVQAGLIEEAAGVYAEGPSLLWLGQGFQRQAHGRQCNA